MADKKPPRKKPMPSVKRTTNGFTQVFAGGKGLVLNDTQMQFLIEKYTTLRDADLAAGKSLNTGESA